MHAIAVEPAAARGASALCRRIAALLFAGTVLVLLAFAPLDLRGMGYSDEEVAASFRLFSWLTAAPEPADAAPLLSTQGIVTRHGIFEPLVKLPFAVAGRLLAPLFPRSPDFAVRFVALLPIVQTALLATLLFLWATRLTANPRWGWTIALGGAFATLLWPYAYSGLEPTQALALLFAGYLALATEPALGGRARTLAFTATAAVAVAAKSTGLLLLPAVAFLVFHYYRRRAAAGASFRPLLSGAATLLVVLATAYGNKLLRGHFFPAWAEADFLRQFLDLNPVRVASSMLMLLFSGNKGVVVYAPAAMLGLACLPAAWRKQRELATFALLVLGSLLAGFSAVGVPAEETWGPRYLYAAVPLLLLCVAAAWGREPFPVRRRLLLAAALLVGFAVSASGSLFYYGRLLQAAQKTDQATLEALWGDPVWNPVVMQLRLTRLWLAPRGTSTVWTPQHHWWFARPPGMPPDKSVDLAFALEPQPVLLRHRTRNRPGLLAALGASLLAGLVALTLAWRATRDPGSGRDAWLPRESMQEKG